MVVYLFSRIHGDVMYKVRKCIGIKDLTLANQRQFFLIAYLRHLFRSISYLINRTNNLMIYLINYAPWLCSTIHPSCNPIALLHTVVSRLSPLDANLKPLGQVPRAPKFARAPKKPIKQ
jgi:hypothetical protein